MGAVPGRRCRAEVAGLTEPVGAVAGLGRMLTGHYVFRLLALDQQLKINGQPSYVEVEKAAAGHIIAEARLVCTYEIPPAG